MFFRSVLFDSIHNLILKFSRTLFEGPNQRFWITWFKRVLVFHTASAGLTGPGQLNQKLCFSVNLDGTRWASVFKYPYVYGCHIKTGENYACVQECCWPVLEIQCDPSCLYIIVQCYFLEQIIGKYRWIRAVSWWCWPVRLLFQIKKSCRNTFTQIW